VGGFERLKASDGHEFDAYRAEASGKPRGGIVVLQEIFGVNEHIRALADKFAREGYTAIAPALFDRIEKNVEFGYNEEDTVKGRVLRGKLGFDLPMLDIKAAIEALRPSGRVGVVGYCWGGSLAWVSAARSDSDCVVGYYGAQIKDFVAEKPRCPVILHFGEKDHLIPGEAVAMIRKAHPEVPVFTYAAGHGFNCDQRGDFDAAAASLAFRRTLEHFRKYIG
jgi:carboxymethylenebutenolidase